MVHSISREEGRGSGMAREHGLLLHREPPRPAISAVAEPRGPLIRAAACLPQLRS